MKPDGTLRFGQAAFDMLCTRLQETGVGVVSDLDAGSDVMAQDICREAARILGIPPEQYTLTFATGFARINVADKPQA